MLVHVSPAEGAPGYVLDMGAIDSVPVPSGVARPLVLAIEGSDPPSVVTVSVEPVRPAAGEMHGQAMTYAVSRNPR